MEKRYRILVQFDSRNIDVKANNKREALKKVKAKLKREPAYKYLDKRNIFVDEL